MRRPAKAALLRLAFSLALLAALLAWLDVAALVAEIGNLAPGWALVALLLTLPQVAISAWRWRFTARLLGLPLSRRAAFADYYLATFLNQLLPGGVMGDVTRAWRHASASGARRPAIRSVIIERVSGQLVLWLIALLALAMPIWHAPLNQTGHAVMAMLTAVDGRTWITMTVVVSAAALLLIRPGRRQPAIVKRLAQRLTAGLGHDLARTLTDTRAWPRQLLASLLVVASYIAVYSCAARAIGTDIAFTTLLALIPPVLLAMALPLSVAGWGLREGAAALVWAGVGLPAEQGVAISMAYGLLVLVSSLPGGAFLLRGRTRSGIQQAQVEQRVVAAAETARRRTARPVETVDRRQGQPGAPGADQQRRHQQVQAVQHVGVDEARHGHAAALDQHTPEPALGQCGQDRLRAGAGRTGGQLETLDVAADTGQDGRTLADQMQRGHLAGLEDAVRGGEPAARIEDNPTRIASLDMAHAELWVVGGDGTGADQHAIDQRAQAMQVNATGEAVDVVRGAVVGGDAPIETLAELGDRQPAATSHQRQQTIEQLAAGNGQFAEVALPGTLPGAAPSDPQAQRAAAQGRGGRH